MTIRIAKAEEVKTLQNLNDEVFIDNSMYDPDIKLDWAQSEKGKGYFSRMLNDKNAICLIAEEEGCPIGYIAAAPREFGHRLKKYIEVENMGVSPSHRSKGVGTELMNKCLEIARQRGFQSVYVTSYNDNNKAVAFYERNGFKRIDMSLEKDL